MIKARELFFIPIIFSWLILWIWTIPFYLIILYLWFNNRQDDIIAFCRGYRYRQYEFSPEVEEQNKKLI